ncbi:MAG: SMP-30/gluconolactonase/LRE family protein [Desulfurellaceae bacterium]|nr:SMP-30/gluconolactonase/LRE family protein [Desulfurellaceae bacterium]
MTPPEILLDGLIFLEGPRWYDGKLWFSDMFAGQVRTVDLSGNTDVVAEVAERPSGLGFLPDGRLLIVSMQNGQLLRLDRTGLTTVADLSGLAVGSPNDMVVDTHGRAYIGHFGYNLFGGEEPRPASLLLVTPDGQVREVADGLEFPNGTVISPDGKTLIVAETFGRRLTAFSIAADGGLSERRVFAQFDEETPDGICLDARGGVWVSSFESGEFVRVEDGGTITDRIPVPGKRAVACALGGPQRQTLFLLTAETTLEDLAQGKSIGRVEAVRVDTPGAGLP